MRGRVLRVRDLLCGYPPQVFRFDGQHLGLHEFLISVEPQRARVYIALSGHICHPVSYHERV